MCKTTQETSSGGERRLLPQTFTVSLDSIPTQEFFVEEKVIGEREALFSDNLVLVKFFELAAGTPFFSSPSRNSSPHTNHLFLGLFDVDSMNEFCFRGSPLEEEVIRRRKSIFLVGRSGTGTLFFSFSLNFPQISQFPNFSFHLFLSFFLS